MNQTEQSMLNRRKNALEISIKDTQKQIKEVLDYVTKDGADRILSNNINTIMPSFIQLHHRLTQLEVELQTLNSFEHYNLYV